MSLKITTSAMAVFLGMFLSTPAIAESSLRATTQDGVNLHHQKLYQMMKDMTQEMSAMTEQMSRGEFTPEQRKQMSRRMAFMSTMMRRMSGLEGRPAMTHEPGWQKRMDEMQKQMDDMKRHPLMKP